MDKMRDDAGARLRRFRLRADMKRPELGKLIGVGATAIQKWEDGQRQMPIDRMKAAAQALGIDWTEFVKPKSEGAKQSPGSVTKVPKSPQGELVPSPDGVIINELAIVGIVQAGLWRDAIEFPPEQQRRVPMAVPAKFDGFKLCAFEVRGPSMDLLFPHGTILAAVKVLDFREPKHEEAVIAVRTRPDGAHESTVKEFRIDKDGVARLWPRSRHPDFQNPIRFDDLADGESVEVTHIVVASTKFHL